MWGFEMGESVSTHVHTQPTFVIHTEQGRRKVVECRMLAAARSMGKVAVKPKLIGRLSTEEKEFLGDLRETHELSSLGRPAIFTSSQGC